MQKVKHSQATAGPDSSITFNVMKAKGKKGWGTLQTENLKGQSNNTPLTPGLRPGAGMRKQNNTAAKSIQGTKGESVSDNCSNVNCHGCQVSQSYHQYSVEQQYLL